MVSSKLSAKAKLSSCQVNSADTVADGADQHRGILEPGEVGVAGEVLGELLDSDVIAPPEGNPVELHPEQRAGEAGEQELVVLQLLAHAHGQCVVPRGKPDRLQLD